MMRPLATSFPHMLCFLFLSVLLQQGRGVGGTGTESVKASYWCPGRCRLSNAGLCHNNYLFIIGTGRSGSTSILKALNQVPGVHLCGETGVIPAFRDLYQAAVAQKQHTRQQLTALLEDQQRLFGMLHPPLSTPSSRHHQAGGGELASTSAPLILGSKEVHVPMELLDFVLLLFPCSRFIFSYRLDLVAQGNSGFHQQEAMRGGERGAAATVQRLAAETDKMVRMHTTLGAFQTFLLPLEHLQQPERLAALLAWLGFRDDCELKRVGHYNFNNTYRKIKAWPRVRGSCRHNGTK